MKVDYIDLIEIAKNNLSEELNKKVEEYKRERTPEKKSEIAKMMQDKREILLFNKNVINKYI